MIALRFRRIPAALVILLSATPLFGQRSDAEVRAEIVFARGLAADWSFVDLAEDVIRDVEDKGVSDRMAEQLGLVKCDVYAIGAKNEEDEVRRHELYEAALSAYADFIEANPYSEARASAEAAFVDTSAAYSRAITTALEEAVGERVAELRSRQAEVLTEAVRRTQDLITALKSLPEDERSEAQTRELYTLMLNRGNMMADIGAAQPDNTYFFDEAIKALENLVFAAGEGTPFAFRGYLALGKTLAAQKKYADAEAYYMAVVEETIPTDATTWRDMLKDMGDTEKEVRFLFLERAIGGLIEALMATGQTEQACSYGLHLYNTQKREGFSYTPFGYLSLLEVANALLDSGGHVGGDLTTGGARWFATEEAMKDAFSSRREQASAVDVALRIARSVNDENKGNVLQLRAQKVISGLIGRPGIELDPQILFEAAQGEYYEGEYLSAIESFRRVLRTVEAKDQATRLAFGAKVMNFIGNCYRKMDRPLESALAFREGCTTWLGDLEYDSTNAQGYYRMIGQAARAANDDKAELTALVSESEKIVAAHGESSRDEVLFTMGKKAARKPLRDYDQAIEHYSEIEKGSNYWEKAHVEIAVCRFLSGDPTAALAGFDQYLDVFLKDPKNASQSQVLLARRQEAQATAEFYRGYIEYNMAAPDDGEEEGEQKPLSEKDKETLRRVASRLADFYSEYPEQENLAAWTMQMVTHCRILTGDLEGAREMLAKMIEQNPDSKYTGLASVQFYLTLESSLEASTDPAERETILREMAQHLERGNASASDASFGNLRNESMHWIELGEWAKAEVALNRLVAKFGDDPEQATSITKFVKPDLGHVLLEEQKVVEAKRVLSELVNNDEATSRATVIDWAHSIVGWLEGDARTIEVVPGAGGTDEEYQDVVTRISQIAAAGDKWVSCEWYAQKFMVAYTYYVWGQEDSRKLESARSQLTQIESETGANYDYVAQYCDSDDTPAELRAELGSNVLQERFKWLRKKLQ